MSEDTLYTYFKIDIQGMPIDWDYTIVETIEQAGEQLKFFDIHLDDPSIDAKVIITGIGMTIKEFVEWEENRVLPLRLQPPVVALPECNQPAPSTNNQREGEKVLRWVRASERLPVDRKPKAARQKDEYMSLRVIEGEMVRVAGITGQSWMYREMQKEQFSLRTQLSEAQKDRDNYKKALDFLSTKMGISTPTLISAAGKEGK